MATSYSRAAQEITKPHGNIFLNYRYSHESAAFWVCLYSGSVGERCLFTLLMSAHSFKRRAFFAVATSNTNCNFHVADVVSR
mmetsp:Transcript_36846/g.56596  ORF Transcript_36846/g.56596 Transcript_36846/m.56596 type:complete len:82 (+) Transcript_36846:342-587(+)